MVGRRRIVGSVLRDYPHDVCTCNSREYGKRMIQQEHSFANVRHVPDGHVLESIRRKIVATCWGIDVSPCLCKRRCSFPAQTCGSYRTAAWSALWVGIMTGSAQMEPVHYKPGHPHAREKGVLGKGIACRKRSRCVPRRTSEGHSSVQSAVDGECIPSNGCQAHEIWWRNRAPYARK